MTRRYRATATRAAFLNAECGSDDGLRQAVESLLAHDHRAEAAFTTAAMQVASRVAGEELAPALNGRQIGVYQIVSRLGAGGMGEVYRARMAAGWIRKSGTS